MNKNRYKAFKVFQTTCRKLNLKDQVRNYNDISKAKIAYQSVYRYLRNRKEKNIIVNEQERIERKYVRQNLLVKKQRVELGVLRSEVNKKIKNLVFIDQWKELITKSLKNQPKIKKQTWKATPKQLEDIWFVMIADFQFCGSEHELFELTRYFNRINNFVIENKITNLHVGVLGDMIDGSIHMTSLSIHKHEAIHQSLIFQNHFLKLINILSQSVQLNIFYVCQDNHGETRIFNTNRSQYDKENFNYLIGAYLKIGLKDNPNVNFQFHPHFTLNIGQNVIYLTHGDLCRSSKQIENWIYKYREVNKIYFNYLFTGHFHHYERKQLCKGLEYILTPTCKAVEFSYEKKANYDSETGILMVKFNLKRLVYSQILYLDELDN